MSLEIAKLKSLKDKVYGKEVLKEAKKKVGKVYKSKK